MKRINNVVIVGLGSIGMVFASHAQKSGKVNLYALVDKERKERYEKDGIMFNGEKYNFDYVQKENEKNIESDLIIIATKSYNLSEAIDMIEKYVGEKTIIISQLNGITSEEKIAERYGSDKTLLSMLIGSSRKTENGFVNNMPCKVYFGSNDNDKQNKNALLLKNFFDEVDIDNVIPDDIVYEMWKKFTMNVGGNQITAITGANYGEVKKSERLQTLIKKLMNETLLIANEAGVKNTSMMIKDAMNSILSLPDVSISSMLQDVLAKRPTEVDIFALTVCELGRKFGIATPYNEMISEILLAIGEKNA